MKQLEGHRDHACRGYHDSTDHQGAGRVLRTVSAEIGLQESGCIARLTAFPTAAA